MPTIPTLALSFVSDVGIFLAHPDHHALVTGSTDDGREDLEVTRRGEGTHMEGWVSVVDIAEVREYNAGFAR